MPMVYIPDTPMGQGYPYPGGVPCDPETIRFAKSIIKANKAEKKRHLEEEKKKEIKNKPQTFTIMETWGMILLFSIPITLGQIWLLHQTQLYLSTVFTNAPN